MAKEKTSNNFFSKEILLLLSNSSHEKVCEWRREEESLKREKRKGREDKWVSYNKRAKNLSLIMKTKGKKTDKLAVF